MITDYTTESLAGTIDNKFLIPHLAFRHFNPSLASGQILQVVQGLRTKEGSQGLLVTLQGCSIHPLNLLVNVVQSVLKYLC